MHHSAGSAFNISTKWSWPKNGIALDQSAKVWRHAAFLKGIVSPDWKGLQMVSLDRFEV
jgi:hypothetical protein